MKIKPHNNDLSGLTPLMSRGEGNIQYMKYTVHRRGIYYHATARFCAKKFMFCGLHMITPYWSPTRLLPSAEIDRYADWSVRAYRWRTTEAKISWDLIKKDFSIFMDWAVASDLQYALEFSFRLRSFFINCNWGASKRRPGGKGRYDARENELERMVKQLAAAIERGAWSTLDN